MKKVFLDSNAVEKKVKAYYSIPEFLMMENAAHGLENAVLNHLGNFYSESTDFNSRTTSFSDKSVFIACGKGNNGADGLALARFLKNKCQVYVYCPEIPKTEEGKFQYEMAKKLGISFNSIFNNQDVFVDCVFGTGFHGEISEDWKVLFNAAKASASWKIACDIPSGISKTGIVSEGTFKANETVTMGAMKLALLSDSAKDFTGRITVADLGISQKDFCELGNDSIFLAEDDDIKLPWRHGENTHKGKFGHISCISGEKAGASILSATAALESGAGLSSIIETSFSNIIQFKLDPSLMITKDFPKASLAFTLGNGLGNADTSSKIKSFLNYFENYLVGLLEQNKNCSLIFDADIFYWSGFPSFFKRISSFSNCKIILTPHPKELAYLCESLELFGEKLNPASALENRVEIGKNFLSLFPNCGLVMKGANTFIAVNERIIILNGGGACLSKAGSGDVLTGILASLLAQNYSLEDACISGCALLGMAAENFGKDRFDLTALKLCSEIRKTLYKTNEGGK